MKQPVWLIFQSNIINRRRKPTFFGFSTFFLLVFHLHILFVVFDKVNAIDLPLRVDGIIALQLLTMPNLTELFKRINSFFMVIVHTVLSVPFRNSVKLKQIAKLHLLTI